MLRFCPRHGVKRPVGAITSSMWFLACLIDHDGVIGQILYARRRSCEGQEVRVDLVCILVDTGPFPREDYCKP